MLCLENRKIRLLMHDGHEKLQRQIMNFLDLEVPTRPKVATELIF